MKHAMPLHEYSQKQSRFLVVCWSAILLIVAVDIIWAAKAGWRVHLPAYTELFHDLSALFMILALIAIGKRFHFNLGQDVEIFLHSVAQCVLLPAAGYSLSYLGGALALPLIDETLIVWDRAMGFDWLAYMAWLNHQPLLSKILTLAYDSMIGQMSLVLPLFCILRRTDYIQHYVSILIFSSLLTVGTFTLFPTLGNYLYYDIDIGQYANIHPADAYQQEPLLSLRDGSLRTMGVNVKGIVSFPSFHTTIGLLLIYITWRVRWLKYVMVPLNGLLVMATLADGGHYLTDLIAGALIACISIAIARYLFLPEGGGELIFKTLKTLPKAEK